MIGSLQTGKGKRSWGKLAAQIVGAYLLFNLLLIPGLALPSSRGLMSILGATFVPALILGGIAWIFVKQGGMNLFRTGKNSAEARFARRPGNSRGSFIYDIEPARHSWASFTLMASILAFVGMLSLAVPYLVVLLPIFLALVLPVILRGAKYRKPVELVLSAEGLSNGDEVWRTEEIAELGIDKSFKIAEGPIVATSRGVPTSTLIGRAIGNRQAERSYLVQIRREGSSQWSVLAGGLTLGCAQSLVQELKHAIDTLAIRQAA